MYCADFYIFSNGKLDWIGSVLKNGEIWKVLFDILLQENQTGFEEEVFEYIRKQNRNGIIASKRGNWPHVWQTSELTDYVYIFDSNIEKVLMYMQGCHALFDPVKIKMGRSLDESLFCSEIPKFPHMNLVSIGVRHGQNFTKTLSRIRKVF